jgi:hypothetical protein
MKNNYTGSGAKQMKNENLPPLMTGGHRQSLQATASASNSHIL